MMCTGSAPLSPEVAEFMKVCFGCPVVEGHGLTETAVVVCQFVNQQHPAATAGHVGPPMGCSEVPIESVPELQCHITDTQPRGEVLIRGPTVFKGCYNRPDGAEHPVDADGWFHTGDIGRLNPNGTFAIIDRKKNIFKLSQGEYVAAEAVEQKLMSSPFVGQVFVYGNSFQNAVVAVVVPDPLELLPHLKSLGGWPGLPTLSPDIETWLPAFATLCKSPHLSQLMLQELDKVGRQADLRGFERIRALHLDGNLNNLMQAFHVENDCLTPTFKLKRKSIQVKYQTEIDAMYKKMECAGKAILHPFTSMKGRPKAPHTQHTHTRTLHRIIIVTGIAAASASFHIH
jgi:long-chain acyl-CoA synthetase